MNIPTDYFDILVILLAMAFFLFGAWFGRFLTRYPFGRKPYAGMEALIGRIGIVRRVRDEILEVTVQGQIWVSENDGVPGIKEGDEVMITGVEGLKLKVARKE